jgi:hypothetical protein
MSDTSIEPSLLIEILLELTTEFMASIQVKEVHEKAPIEEDRDKEAEADELLHQNGELELPKGLADET